MAKRGTSARKKQKYEQYKNNGTRDKNKIRDLKRHIKKYPEDTQAQQALKKLS